MYWKSLWILEESIYIHPIISRHEWQQREEFLLTFTCFMSCFPAIELPFVLQFVFVHSGSFALPNCQMTVPRNIQCWVKIYWGNELSGVLLRGWGHSTITSLPMTPLLLYARTTSSLTAGSDTLDRRRDSTSKGSKRTLFILPAPGCCSLKKRSARDLYDTHCDEEEKSVGEWNRRNILFFYFFITSPALRLELLEQSFDSACCRRI